MAGLTLWSKGIPPGIAWLKHNEDSGGQSEKQRKPSEALRKRPKLFPPVSILPLSCFAVSCQFFPKRTHPQHPYPLWELPAQRTLSEV